MSDVSRDCSSEDDTGTKVGKIVADAVLFILGGGTLAGSGIESAGFKVLLVLAT